MIVSENNMLQEKNNHDLAQKASSYTSYTAQQDLTNEGSKSGIAEKELPDSSTPYINSQQDHHRDTGMNDVIGETPQTMQMQR